MAYLDNYKRVNVQTVPLSYLMQLNVYDAEDLYAGEPNSENEDLGLMSLANISADFDKKVFDYENKVR